MKTFNQYLEETAALELVEEVEVDHSTFMGSHGKKARGSGLWLMSKHKKHDPDNHKDGEDFHTGSGPLTTVARDAAKRLKTTRVYVQP